MNHPSLPDHPDHALYEKYFPNGGASIFTFEIRGGQKEAWAFILARFITDGVNTITEIQYFDSDQVG